MVRHYSLKAKPNKFPFVLLGKNIKSKFCLKINGAKVLDQEIVTLLGIVTDKKLSFKPHIDNLLITNVSINSIYASSPLKFTSPYFMREIFEAKEVSYALKGGESIIDESQFQNFKF